MNIEIKGVQFINKGAELMLHAVIQQLAILEPDASIVLRPNKGSPYAKRTRLGAYQKLTLTKNRVDLNNLTYYLPVKVRDWLKTKWGIITEADIDLTLDASGFAYGDQWSSVALRQLASELSRYDRRNKKYIFLPQALGPFTRKVDRKILTKALPKATLIIAREKTSFENVSSLGVGSDTLIYYPDFTNLVAAKLPGYFDYTEPVFTVVPNSKMVSLKNKNEAWRQNYIQVLVNAINLAGSLGLKPVLLNHEGDADKQVCEQLQDQLVKPISQLHEENPIYVKGILGHSKLVLCSRFHGCVSALSQGVACLGTSWSYKYERLFEDYGQSEMLLSSPPDKGQLKEIMTEAVLGHDQINLERISQLKTQSAEMWECVNQHLA